MSIETNYNSFNHQAADENWVNLDDLLNEYVKTKDLEARMINPIHDSRLAWYFENQEPLDQNLDQNLIWFYLAELDLQFGGPGAVLSMRSDEQALGFFLNKFFPELDIDPERVDLITKAEWIYVYENTSKIDSGYKQFRKEENYEKMGLTELSNFNTFYNEFLYAFEQMHPVVKDLKVNQGRLVVWCDQDLINDPELIKRAKEHYEQFKNLKLMKVVFK
ncbi:hypothetical protein ACFLZY_02935 [Patescibacteria group bacterium]